QVKTLIGGVNCPTALLSLSTAHIMWSALQQFVMHPMTRVVAAGVWIFLTASFLGAQAPDTDDESDESRSYIEVSPSPNGNVSFQVSGYDLTKAQNVSLLQ